MEISSIKMNSYADHNRIQYKNSVASLQTSPSFCGAGKQLATGALVAICVLGSCREARAKDTNNYTKANAQCQELYTAHMNKELTIPGNIVNSGKNNEEIKKLNKTLRKIHNSTGNCIDLNIRNFLSQGTGNSSQFAITNASIMQHREKEINRAYKALLEFRYRLSRFARK